MEKIGGGYEKPYSVSWVASEWVEWGFLYNMRLLR